MKSSVGSEPQFEVIMKILNPKSNLMVSYHKTVYYMTDKRLSSCSTTDYQNFDLTFTLYSIDLRGFSKIS